MLFYLLGYEFAKTTETKRLIYYGAVGFLVMIFTLQDCSVSFDIAEYMRQWTIIPKLSLQKMLNHKFEIGYVLLCWFLEKTFASDRVLLIVLSVLIMLPFSRSFEKETENPMIAMMAFLALGMYMHAIVFWRQLVSMALLTYSYRYIRERKLLPFLWIVLMAMTFHKVAVVFLGLYIVYNVPINKWLLIACVFCAVVLYFLGKPIIEFGIAVIYPRYKNSPRVARGGENLLAVIWIIVFLSYWVLHDRMHEGKIRLPFLMLLIAATIQPICFSFYNWQRVVLPFRVALVPMTTHLYMALFEKTEGNRILLLLEKFAPPFYAFVRPMYGKRWFRVATLLILFAVLFVWYESELEGAVYTMAPII